LYHAATEADADLEASLPWGNPWENPWGNHGEMGIHGDFSVFEWRMMGFQAIVIGFKQYEL